MFLAVYRSILLIACVVYSFTLQGQNALVDQLNTLHQQVYDSAHQQPQRTLQLAQLEKKLSEQSGSQLLVLQSLTDLSLCYGHTGRFDSALYLARLCVNLSVKNKNDSLKAGAYASLGNAFFKKGLGDSAVFYQLKSLKIREAIGPASAVINSLYNLGAISNSIGNTEDAFNYFNACLQAADKQSDLKLLALANEGMASYYYANGKYDKAIDFYKKSKAIYVKLNNEQGIALCLLNLGSLYDELEQPQQSIAAYKQALLLFEKAGSKENILLAYSNLGVTHANNNQTDIALAYHKKALFIAEELKLHGPLQNVYQNLSDTWRLKGNADSAFKYFDNYLALKNKQLDIERLKNINELQETYKKEKREREIRHLKEQEQLKNIEMSMHKKRNSLLVITVALLATLAALIFLIYRQRIRNAADLADKNEQLYRRKIDDILKDQELKSINSLMEGQESERKRIAEDLHDRLGSMLATIKLHFNAIEHKVDHLELKNREQYNRANKLLDEVCDEVRRIAHNMESGVLVNFGLIPALTDLKEALQQSSALGITIGSFGMNERLDTNIEINLYRAIQELISNVIKHANATEINIDLNRSDNQLTLIFSDNGTGYDPETRSNGMGIKNISSRIARLGGKFYVDSGKMNGTTNIIEISLNDDKTAHS